MLDQEAINLRAGAHSHIALADGKTAWSMEDPMLSVAKASIRPAALRVELWPIRVAAKIISAQISAFTVDGRHNPFSDSPPSIATGLSYIEYVLHRR